MLDANSIATAYLSTWNEADPARREQLLDAHWTEDARYVDPLAESAGHSEISALIAGVQGRFPGFRFRLEGEPNGYGERVRFSWMLGPENEPDMIKGTDFVLLEQNKLKSVTGFLDKAPAA